jgi:hypothetical protein
MERKITNMKKIILLILVLISIQSFGQHKRKYAERLNTDGTIDSFYVKTLFDSVFAYSNDAFICLTVESFEGQFNPQLPSGFANYTKCADGVYRNYNPRSEFALKSNTVNFGIDNGANDSYVITLSPAPLEYTNGMMILFRANTNNTGAASINVNGLGAKTIVKRVSTTLANGDIPALAVCLLIYDGTTFVLLNPVVN